MFAATSLADGIALTRVVDGAPMPAQCAVLAWRDGIQTLAIRTEIESGAGPAAWVVPTPSIPEVFEVAPGVIESARAGFAPSIAANSSMVPMIGALFAIAICGLHMAALLRRGGVWTLGLTGLAIAFLGAILLPALGRSRGLSDEVVADVAVHEQRIIGEHEVAVISSADSAALSEWLEKFGFTVPPAASGPIEAYCKEGWSFVAARLLDVERGINAPTPVGMRFKADAPVYPMRLTGAGNAASGRSLDLELLVYSTGTARVLGMEVLSSGEVRAFNASHTRSASWRPQGAIEVTHPGVRRLVEGASWATRLRGSFTPAAMATDIKPVISTRETVGRVAISKGELRERYFGAVAIVFCVMAVFTLPLSMRRQWTGRRAAAAVLLVVVGGLLGGAAASRGLHIVEIETFTGQRASREFRAHYDLEAAIWIGGAKTADEARELVRKHWAQGNPDGDPIIFGWGPNQFVLSEYTFEGKTCYGVGRVSWFGQYHPASHELGIPD